MQKVFVANDPIEANFVKDLLIRGGVAAEIQGEHLFGLRPRIGFADPTLYPSVWIINEGQLEEARALIADYERRKRIS
jgi:Putative prokaryotic signal transducing protein